MEKSIDIETIALKMESQENRIKVLEHLIFDSKDVLTLEEAAAYLGISKSTLYKLRRTAPCLRKKSRKRQHAI